MFVEAFPVAAAFVTVFVVALTVPFRYARSLDDAVAFPQSYATERTQYALAVAKKLFGMIAAV